MSFVIDLARSGKTVFYPNTGEDTQKIGEALGKEIREKTIITLTGDLGSGKTTFIQGLARGVGVPKEYYVTSPTYTLINEYPGRWTVYHLDLYRLGDIEELYDIGLDDLFDRDAVFAIEWPDSLFEMFRFTPIRVHIEWAAQLSFPDQRCVTIEIP